MASRRMMVAGGCAMLLAGCQTYGGEDAAPQVPGPAQPNPGGSGGGTALAKVAEIPLGGGRIFPEQGVVLTQPAAGVVMAFSAKCTHQGCTVADVTGGTINCPCHGSAFKVADGSVATGPATRALPAIQVIVKDGEVKLAG